MLNHLLKNYKIRRAHNMVTPQQLRTRPVVLRLRLAGNEKTLNWLINEEHEYSRLEHMSGKDCVDYMLTDASIVNTEEEKKYAGAIRDFISRDCKGYYSIGTVNMGTMVCSTYQEKNTQGEYVTKIYQDERTQKITDRLISINAKEDLPIWYQELKIMKNKFVC